jgi:hypothetical protein
MSKSGIREFFKVAATKRSDSKGKDQFEVKLIVSDKEIKASPIGIKDKKTSISPKPSKRVSAPPPATSNP